MGTHHWGDAASCYFREHAARSQQTLYRHTLVRGARSTADAVLWTSGFRQAMITFTQLMLRCSLG